MKIFMAKKIVFPKRAPFRFSFTEKMQIGVSGKIKITVNKESVKVTWQVRRKRSGQDIYQIDETTT